MPLRRHRHRREEFEQSQVHEYPQHLRDAIQDAPTAAGVYTFHGEAGDLPGEWNITGMNGAPGQR